MLQIHLLVIAMEAACPESFPYLFVLLKRNPTKIEGIQGIPRRKPSNFLNLVFGLACRRENCCTCTCSCVFLIDLNLL